MLSQNVSYPILQRGGSQQFSSLGPMVPIVLLLSFFGDDLKILTAQADLQDLEEESPSASRVPTATFLCEHLGSKILVA